MYRPRPPEDVRIPARTRFAPRPLRTLVAIPAAFLLGCAAKQAPLPPLDRDPLDALIADSSPTSILALDAYAHEHQDPAAAAWWTAIQADESRDVAVRTCAAVANARLGFPHGEDFCFAVLRAGLLSAKESDREHALPETDRLAFAREIALDWLRGRLASAAVEPPPFDVNFGAPQLEAAANAMEAACKALGTLRPDVDATTLSSRIPETAPPGLDPRDWIAARDLCIQECLR